MSNSFLPSYANGIVVPASYFQGIDTAQADSLSGDGGGTASPASAIEVGGAGVWLCGPSFTSPGATITTPSGSGYRIVHAADDVPLLSAGHLLSTRIIATPCLVAGMATNTFAKPITTTTPYASVILWPPSPFTNGARLLMPLDVHELGTFVSAKLQMFILTGHSVLPSQLPSMRIVAIDAFGDVTPLGGQPGTAGFITMTAPANVAAYSNLPQIISYPIDASTVIDKLHYTYFAEIIDESGFGATGFNLFEYVECIFEDIGSLYPS